VDSARCPVNNTEEMADGEVHACRNLDKPLNIEVARIIFKGGSHTL
jgi:hypothetical protein